MSDEVAELRERVRLLNRYAIRAIAHRVRIRDDELLAVDFEGKSPAELALEHIAPCGRGH